MPAVRGVLDCPFVVVGGVIAHCVCVGADAACLAVIACMLASFLLVDNPVCPSGVITALLLVSCVLSACRG